MAGVQYCSESSLFCDTRGGGGGEILEDFLVFSSLSTMQPPQLRYHLLDLGVLHRYDKGAVHPEVLEGLNGAPQLGTRLLPLSPPF